MAASPPPAAPRRRRRRDDPTPGRGGGTPRRRRGGGEPMSAGRLPRSRRGRYRRRRHRHRRRRTSSRTPARAPGTRWRSTRGAAALRGRDGARGRGWTSVRLLYNGFGERVCGMGAGLLLLALLSSAEPGPTSVFDEDRVGIELGGRASVGQTFWVLAAAGPSFGVDVRLRFGPHLGLGFALETGTGKSPDIDHPWTLHRKQ